VVTTTTQRRHLRLDGLSDVDVTWNVDETNPLAMDVESIEGLLSTKSIGHDHSTHLRIHEPINVNDFALNRRLVSQLHRGFTTCVVSFSSQRLLLNSQIRYHPLSLAETSSSEDR